MSTSSAPAETAYLTSASLTSTLARPLGNAVATLATCTPLPFSSAAATWARSGYTQTAATIGTAGSAGSGRLALAHSARTLPGVSWPSSVVRSIIEMAVSSAHCLAVVLMDRLASMAARASAPTRSTPGSPCRKPRNSGMACVGALIGDSLLSPLRRGCHIHVVPAAWSWHPRHWSFRTFLPKPGDYLGGRERRPRRGMAVPGRTLPPRNSTNDRPDDRGCGRDRRGSGYRNRRQGVRTG